MKSFDAHLYAVEKRVAKALSREKVYLTVVFVGETHNTIDERRRAHLFGYRPSSPDVLTVIERGMGMAVGGGNLVVEPASSLAALDPQRDTNLVAQIASAYAIRPVKVIYILFGEDHEHKVRPLMEACPGLPEMIWHFYPSYSDHMKARGVVYMPSDPRAGGYTLIGMIRMQGKSKLDLRQLAEGIMPTGGNYLLAVMSPFDGSNPKSNFGLFAKDPLLTQVQNGLNAKLDAKITINEMNVTQIKVLDLEGLVRPVPADLNDDVRRGRLIEEFWADAA